MIDIQVDGDGIAVLTFDMPDRAQNVFNQGSIDAIAAAVEKVAADDAIKGAVLTSGKKDYAAGADLEMIEAMTRMGPDVDVAEATKGSGALGNVFRRLETCGKPFVAAMPGTALGGGFEMALACHYRIAADNPRAKFGLPESQLGLLPGAGGTQRLPRMIGMQAAIPLLLEGKQLSAEKALKAGLIDKVVPADSLIAEAKAWLKTEPAAAKPWDVKGFKVPGGAPNTPAGKQLFMATNAMVHEKTYGNFPASRAILSCLYEGLIVDMDGGLKVEARYFTQLMLDPVAGNMVRTLFLGVQAANKLHRRPEGVPKSKVKKLGMLGAGLMGAGIAYVSASVGIEVVLIDVSQEGADKGKDYSRKLCDKMISRGRMSEEKAQALLDRITPTTDYSKLEGADFVVEAVFEDRDIKAKVTQQAEAVILKDAVFGSNTSTLPITGLAEASSRPENFIGIHYFSPVEKMALVEVIVGEKTTDETLARTLDYIQQIRKTPIVVNDSRGFYTSRVFGTFINEGMAMLNDGVPAAAIENVAKQTGMPMAPLALSDDLSLELFEHVRQQNKTDLGENYVPNVSDPTVQKMLAAKRTGRRGGAGFYDYSEEGKRVALWSGLREMFPAESSKEVDIQELRDRYLYVQAIETARCVEEGVIESAIDTDVGSILGWGFAPWTGGPLSYIDMIGAAKFVERADYLADSFGERFRVPQLLRDMAAKGERFHS